jgi:serine/threonine protein kinase
MSQPVHRRLKKAKAFLGRPSNDTNNVRSTSTDSGAPEKVRRMLRILLKSPWDDFSYIRHLDQTMLAVRKASSFQLAEIREVSSFDVLGDPPILPHVQHPNIATLYDIYCDDDRIFLITEHLEVSFAQLKFQEYELEERAIATILAEVPRYPQRQSGHGLQRQVLKGVAYISSLRLSCKNLSQKNVWLSLDGEIKLG